MGSQIIVNSNKVTDIEPSSLGIIVEKPKFPHYAHKSNRLESFATWPDSNPIGKDVLVDAGFVFTGIDDNVRCYYCGGGFKKWERGDVPMAEHAKWFPRCPHVLLVEGQEYVDKINRGDKPNGDSDNEGTAEVTGIDSIAARSLMEIGYSRKTVENAIAVFKDKHGNIDFNAVQLCEVLFDLESNTCSDTDDVAHSSESSYSDDDIDMAKLQQLQAENNQLKELISCKICMEEKACIGTLPCRHMVVCPQCAPALSECPICKETINGYIKVPML